MAGARPAAGSGPTRHGKRRSTGKRRSNNRTRRGMPTRKTREAFGQPGHDRDEWRLPVGGPGDVSWRPSLSQKGASGNGYRYQHFPLCGGRHSGLRRPCPRRRCECECPRGDPHGRRAPGRRAVVAVLGLLGWMGWMGRARGSGVPAPADCRRTRGARQRPSQGRLWPRRRWWLLRLSSERRSWVPPRSSEPPRWRWMGPGCPSPVRRFRWSP